MTELHQSEPFSSVDTTWLRMDDPTNLMVISGMIQLGEPVDPKDIAAVIEQRLLPFDRFRQRVVDPVLGRPHWHFDEHFDIRSHIHAASLPAPRDRHALRALVSDLIATPLDRTRPLWQLHIIDDYEGGSVIVYRLHHAIADGFALHAVMLSLTDSGPVPAARLERPSCADASSKGPRAWIASAAKMVSHPARAVPLVTHGAGGAAAIGRLLLLPPDPRTPLKGQLGVAKKVGWSEPIALTRIKALGKAAGATVNDVLLAAISGGLRNYLLEKGHDVSSLELRAIVPVNLRNGDPPERLGNKFGLAFVSLPIGLPEPAQRLQELHRRTTHLKASTEPAAAFGVLASLGLVTSGLEGSVVKLFGNKATAVISNVPGPREARFLAGKPIRSMMFWVPQSGRLGLGVSIFSYTGQVVLGVATDAQLVPDPDLLLAGCVDELDNLRLSH